MTYKNSYVVQFIHGDKSKWIVIDNSKKIERSEILKRCANEFEILVGDPVDKLALEFKDMLYFQEKGVQVKDWGERIIQECACL